MVKGSIKRRKLPSFDNFDDLLSSRNDKSSQRLINRERNGENSYLDHSNYEESIQILRKNVNESSKSNAYQDQINSSLSSSVDQRYQSFKRRLNKLNISKLNSR